MLEVAYGAVIRCVVDVLGYFSHLREIGLAL